MFTQNLYFVSSQDTHCKKSIRRHVMRDYICRKRAQEHMRMSFVASLPFRWQRARHHEQRTGRHPPPSFGNPRATGSTLDASEGEVVRPQGRFSGLPSPVPRPKDLVDSPQSVLGAGRTNPFPTYPVKDLDKHVDMLIDHCKCPRSPDSQRLDI
jgi:hypothetical protein